MISLTLKIVLIILTLLYLYIVVKSVRKRKLQTSFSIFWIITGIILIIATLFPEPIEYIANILGFEKTSNMIFCLAIFIAFYLVFNLTILLSKEFNRNIGLIQEVSILKKRVNELEKDSNKDINELKDSTILE